MYINIYCTGFCLGKEKKKEKKENKSAYTQSVCSRRR